MNGFRRIFDNVSRGGMLIELMLCIALAMAIIPFIFRYQQQVVARSQNIAIANQMSGVQTALERYIMANRADLMRTVGRDIVRVELSDLAEYGLDEDMIANRADKYQLRVLKLSGPDGRDTLQGVVILSDSDITPLRTHEIVNLSGGEMGFIDGRRAHGAFGAWRTDSVDLGINTSDAIIGMTGVNRDNAMYLWRVPSQNASDATMQASLNLGGHDIIHAKNFDTRAFQFQETLKSSEIVTDTLVFQNRTTVDNNYKTQNAVCSGILSSDSRNMQVDGNLTIADVAKFSSFTTNDLWVSNLTLSGLSITGSSGVASMQINQSLDMVGGRIDAAYVTVGYSGSVSPRLVVKRYVFDSVNPDYFWDVTGGVANFGDLSLAELNRLAPVVLRMDVSRTTQSVQIFGGIVANKNATASDYINAIKDIQSRVRAKYRQLQLQ